MKKSPPWTVHRAGDGRRGDEAAGGGAGDDLRLVVQNAAHAAMAAQDGGEQVAVRAADVDQRLEAAEIEGAGDGVVLRSGDAGHRLRRIRGRRRGCARRYSKIGMPWTWSNGS